MHPVRWKFNLATGGRWGTGSGGLQVIEDVPQDVGDDKDVHRDDGDAPEDAGD